MSDALLLIESIAGLVQISAKIIGIANQVYYSSKDAPASISRIKDEMGQLNLIFRQVQRLIEGYERKNLKHHRLTMLPLHDLMIILTGCVLAYSALDKRLSKIAGLVDETDPENPIPQTQAPSSARSLSTCVKWGLWKESEATEIIANIEQHKSSLNTMLTIIQSEDTSADAENLDKLRDLVEKISDTIAETYSENSMQLQEFLDRHYKESNIPEISAGASSGPAGNDDHDDTASTASTTFSRATTLISGSANRDSGSDDRASVRTTATATSLRSIRSLMSFTGELRNSGPYKRVERSRLRRGTTDRDSHSFFSKDSTESKGDRWSMLSDLSLGDLSISEISVLELPINISDLYDPTPYRSPQANLGKTRRGIKWSSRGRIHEAIRKGNAFVVKTLLNLGADFEEMNRMGRTPLSYAATFSTPTGYEACKLLLERGANVNTVDNNTGRTPLSFAAGNGGEYNYESCKLLLDKGAIVDSSDASGRTPLSYAAGSSGELISTTICQFLADSGANINSVDNTGRTPLSYAAARYHHQSCKLLLDRGASVDFSDAHGRTPLSYAAGSLGRSAGKICHLLSNRGANINSVDNTGRSPLSYAVGTGQMYSYSSCKALLDNGATVDSIDASGRTPLSYAAESSGGFTINICQLFLHNGADVNSVDVYGKRPLDYVNRNWRGGSELWNLLLEKGAINRSN